jgi:hypothetical protein
MSAAYPHPDDDVVAVTKDVVHSHRSVGLDL